MKLNLKQPKYILPLVALPFLCLFFYVYHSGAAKTKKEQQHQAGINASVGDVSADIKKRNLEDKLDAYRDKYKEADGASAVIPIPAEKSVSAGFPDARNDPRKRQIDSINRLMQLRYHTPGREPPAVSDRDKELALALNNLSARQKQTAVHYNSAASPKEKDPMGIFKQQMAYMDSVQKANDPATKAEKQKKEALAKAEALKAKEISLTVSKVNDSNADFNTVMPQNDNAFIMAVIDENLTGYAGSRIRLRLLEDIKAGNTFIGKGAYLYALINGFSEQRVTLAVKSILYGGKILPVKLDIYDLDGLPGLYVPQSAFRDFTKDAGTSVMQGVDVQSSSTSFLVSAAGQLFQSTSSAIAEAIRKNKTKLKYNSYIYLIDDKTQNP